MGGRWRFKPSTPILKLKGENMSNCNIEWSACKTCSYHGSNLCPLENNRTIEDVKRKLRDFEDRLYSIESKLKEND